MKIIKQFYNVVLMIINMNMLNIYYKMAVRFNQWNYKTLVLMKISHYHNK